MKYKIIEDKNKYFIENTQLDGTKYYLRTLYPKYNKLLLIRHISPSYEARYFKSRESAEMFLSKLNKVSN